MQLQARLGAAPDAIAEHQQQGAWYAIQGHLVHAIQRHVEHPRQPAFEHDAAGQVAHQVTDRGEARQRDQRAVIAIAVFRQRLAADLQAQRLGQQRCLLVCRLGARWHVAPFVTRLRAGSAIAEGEHVVIERGLECRAYLQLVDAVALQAIELFEKKEVQFIVNCKMLGQGIDIKGCTDVFLSRSFNSKAEKEQYIGRSIRIDSESQVWEFVNPYGSNVLTKNLFSIYRKERMIYFQHGEWHCDTLVENDPDELYDHDYLESVA